MQPLDWPTSWGAPPRWATRRNRSRATHGPAVAEISRLLGKPVMPWQRYVLDVATEVDSDTGGPWYQTVVLLVPRRSGKTVLVPPLAAKTCGQPETRSVWMTAQKRDNAVKRWRDATEPLVPLLTGVAKRKVSHSFEEMRWTKTGSLFVPFAPNEESMHGEDPDVVIVDELWALPLSHFRLIREGYSAAWSVKPGQEWLLSAAGTHASTALKDVRRRGRASTQDAAARTAFFEWCIPETVAGRPAHKLGDDDLLELLMANHPRAGRGLRPDFVAEQLRDDKRAAIRAYGGLDADTSEEESVIDSQAVRRSLDRVRRIPAGARVAFGLASDPELRQAGISVAWVDPQDGVVLTELIEVRDQVRWSTTAAVGLLGRWPGSVVYVRSDAGGRDLADEVLAEMQRAGVESWRLERVAQSDYAAACHRFRTSVESDPPRLLHAGERDLRRALVAADVRRGVWVPARGPVAVLDAHTLAAWGAGRLPEPPAVEVPFRIL